MEDKYIKNIGKCVKRQMVYINKPIRVEYTIENTNKTSASLIFPQDGKYTPQVLVILP